MLERVHGARLPIVAFAVTGYASVLLWRNCANRCALAITPNQSLLYHRSVKLLDVFVARILLEVAGVTGAFAALVAVFVAAGAMEAPHDLGIAIAGWGILVMFSAGLALVVGALTERSDVIERLWHPFSYFLFPISGAVFMVDWLPAAWQDIALLVPSVSGVELLREGFFGASINARHDVAYALGSGAVLVLVGLLLVRDAARRVQPE
jgi:capsular polysaccharide transport system permease protein